MPQLIQPKGVLTWQEIIKKNNKIVIGDCYVTACVTSVKLEWSKNKEPKISIDIE